MSSSFEPEYLAIPGPAIRRAMCPHCHTVYVIVLDPVMPILDLEIAGPRCSYCDPGTSRGSAWRDSSPDGRFERRFEVEWATAEQRAEGSPSSGFRLREGHQDEEVVVASDDG